MKTYTITTTFFITHAGAKVKLERGETIKVSTKDGSTADIFIDSAKIRVNNFHDMKNWIRESRNTKGVTKTHRLHLAITKEAHDMLHELSQLSSDSNGVIVEAVIRKEYRVFKQAQKRSDGKTARRYFKEMLSRFTN